MKSQIISFENPPVNEVVVSTYFNPPLSDFRNEHIGLFWERIRREFPIVRQQHPVGIRPHSTTDESSSMPRYWFIADNDINLIQIQKNAFMFNWRRRGENYPRFHRHIKPAFDKYYGLFSEFIRTEIKTVEKLAVDLCELAYINALEPCELWSGFWSLTSTFLMFRHSIVIMRTRLQTIYSLISAYVLPLRHSNQRSQY